MTRRWLAGLTVVLGSCSTVVPFSGTFDTPSPLAVLPQGVPSPFDRPVGYAADLQGGRIRVLDLVRGLYLSTDPLASFFRGKALATGGERLLAGLAAWAPDANRTVVFAIDRRFDQLLAVPHVDGFEADGSPREVEPTVASLTFTDAGEASPDVALAGLRLGRDRAASETWTITFDGTVWQVEGSRSGRQPPAWPGVAWLATTQGLAFVPEGTATEGDRFELVVDSGLVEVQLPGAPVDLSMAPDQSLLSLVHADDGGTVLRLVPPDSLDLGTPVTFPTDARPVRSAWSADSATLYLADAGRSAVWELDVATSTLTEHVVPWPTLDVAPLDTDTGRELFVAPVGGDSVWLLDPATDTFIDVNTATPEIDGMLLRSNVTGIAAMPIPYEWPSQDETNPPIGRTVAISLTSGRVVWMKEHTGCLVGDRLGPRTQLVSSVAVIADYEPSYAISIPGTAYLDEAEDPSRHVTVNPCAGIARGQSWRLTYDELEQGWRVDGTLTGKQQALAREDRRYVSDSGEISFVVRAGGEPSQDGWTIQFNVLDGVLDGDGDNDGDRVREVEIDNPGRPLTFLGAERGEARPYVVIAAQASDILVRLDPTDGSVDAVWD